MVRHPVLFQLTGQICRMYHHREHPCISDYCNLAAFLLGFGGADKKSLVLAVLCLGPAFGEHEACMARRTLLWVWRTKVESTDLSNFSILVQNILLDLFWFPFLLQRPRVRIGFRKEMVWCSERTGSRAWGDLGLFPRFVLAVGWLWAKQIPCLQNGHSKTPGVSTCLSSDSSLENSFYLGVCLLNCPSWTK